MRQVIKPVAMVFFISILFAGMVSGSDMNSPIKFHPIKHATMVIQSKTVTIYVDPVGDPELFSQYPKPDLILITDIHSICVLISTCLCLFRFVIFFIFKESHVFNCVVSIFLGLLE